MRGNSPIRPALLAVPIAAFVLAGTGDLWYILSRDVFWLGLGRAALIVGLSAGLVAALAELVDGFFIAMSARGRRLARLHLACSWAALALFAFSLFLRSSPGSEAARSSWPLAAGASFGALAVLGVAAWLAGRIRSERRPAAAADLHAGLAELERGESAALLALLLVGCCGAALSACGSS